MTFRILSSHRRSATFAAALTLAIAIRSSSSDRHDGVHQIQHARCEAVVNEDLKPSGVHFKPHEIMKFGHPGFENLKRKDGHVLSYNRKHKTANWVAERLNRDSLLQVEKNCFECVFDDCTCDVQDLYTLQLWFFKRTSRNKLYIIGRKDRSVVSIYVYFSSSVTQIVVNINFTKTKVNPTCFVRL